MWQKKINYRLKMGNLELWVGNTTHCAMTPLHKPPASVSVFNNNTLNINIFVGTRVQDDILLSWTRHNNVTISGCYSGSNSEPDTLGAAFPSEWRRLYSLSIYLVSDETFSNEWYDEAEGRSYCDACGDPFLLLKCHSVRTIGEKRVINLSVAWSLIHHILSYVLVYGI